MTGRARFTPAPITWHVPPSQRGHIEAAPERHHPRLVRLWVYPDGPGESPASLVLTHADIRRLCAVLIRLLPPPEVPR
jgi:hypothetical protein